MGLKTPEINGARQDLPCLESPEIDGARQAVASVKKYVDGAWTEIWSAVKTLILTLSKERTYTRTEYADGEYQLNGQNYKTAYSFSVGNKSDFTWLTEEGSFTNPTIKCVCHGSRYRPNYTTSNYSPADMYVVGINADGTETAIEIGEARTLNIDYTLEGTYKQVGIRANVLYDSSNYTWVHTLAISTVSIDGKEYIA